MSSNEHFMPIPDFDSQEFWAGCKNRELLIRRCCKCKTYRIPPGPGCPEWGAMESDWVKIDGKGEIFSYTIVCSSNIPGFAETVPYNIVVVSLSEADDVNILSNLVDCPNEDIHVGMPVEVVFEDVPGGQTLPLFRPVSTG